MPQKTSSVRLLSENVVIEFQTELTVYRAIRFWIAETFRRTKTSYYMSSIKEIDQLNVIARYNLPAYDVSRFVANLRMFCEEHGFTLEDEREKK